MTILRRSARFGLILATAFCLNLSPAADPQAFMQPVGPLSPKEELATFRVPKGFKVELVACEPDVVDPVAMAFDEDGRLYVAEMPGYPNAGVGTGDITSGRVKLLEDRDGDGFFEHATTFVEGLRFPTSVMPWKGGLLLANAPDLIYCEDTNGDGKADKQRTLYTGFNLVNIQQLLNSLQWGLDNWVYGCAGSNGGTARSVEKPDAPAVELRSRGVRFRPDDPASLEPTSGGGQYGLAPNEWQQWFTATNSQHLRHIVLPDHYLRRNPALPVAAVTLDIPDHGAACKVFRISPFEGWRVERTRRRKEGTDSKRFASTELVPGGFITSACSPVIYAADLFPDPYRGNVFVCDPANNLIHRDVLVPKGATFVAQRADADCEFLASTDNWFRPVFLSIGPEGALYVLDFYREVIETPLSLPDDIKKRLNLESRGRGRIWRIVPEGSRPASKLSLRKATTEDLVKLLADRNLWRRLTAQRLLVERKDAAAVALARRLAKEELFAPGRAHALWTLHAHKALQAQDLIAALKDAEPGIREQALRLAEERLNGSPALRGAVEGLADDPSPRVRFQLAFTLGESDSPESVSVLAGIIRRDLADPWTVTAALSSSGGSAPALLEELAKDVSFTGRAMAGHLQLLTRLAALVGARPGDGDLARALQLVGLQSPPGAEEWQLAILDGLGQGMQNSGRSLARIWEQPPKGLDGAVKKAEEFFRRATETSRDSNRPAPVRVAALRRLGYGPFALAEPALRAGLAPQNPAEVQLAAVRALSQHDQPKVAELLLESWTAYSPTLRREVTEALFARPARLAALLTAVEQKKVLANQLEPGRLELLRKHPDRAIRQRALTVLTALPRSDRQAVVDSYRAALDLTVNLDRGKAVFKNHCATCHRLENEGIEVGPDLLAALRNKSREALLTDILDPGREVDSRYNNYVIATKAGRVFTGLIATETASSITLRRAERAEDTILRAQIDEIQATSQSLMPEGLEMQLSKQEVADLIGYLEAVSRPN